MTSMWKKLCCAAALACFALTPAGVTEAAEMSTVKMHPAIVRPAVMTPVIITDDSNAQNASQTADASKNDADKTAVTPAESKTTPDAKAAEPASKTDTESAEPAEKDATDKPLPANVKHLDLVLILDKSGSMYRFTDDTIGGYNSMIAKEKDLDVDTKVTTVLFNQESSVVTNRESIGSIAEMTNKDYHTGGSTALLDAVGNTISKVEEMPDIDANDHKVIVVIITDGLENASHEYDRSTVKYMITRKQKDGWDFVFLGANMDAVAEAGSLGIDTRNAVKYRNTKKGVQQNYEAVALYTAAIASGARSEAWKDAVEQDQ